jgi:hypothetical protein
LDQLKDGAASEKVRRNRAATHGSLVIKACSLQMPHHVPFVGRVGCSTFASGF